jgi:lipopolysaccharide exporter
MSSKLARSSSKLSRRGRPPGAGSRSLSSSVRRGAAWSALSSLLLRLSNVAITAVVAHILAPRDFGIFTVALTVYTIVFNLAEFGVGSCLIRADLDIDSVAPTMVTVALLTSAISAEMMAVFARPIATALGSADGAEPVRVMALTVLIGGLSSVPSGQLTRDFQQDKLFLANFISLVPSTAVLLILAESGSGAMAFAWSRVVAAFVMCVVMMASVRKHYLPGINRNALSVLFRFGLPLAGANFVNFILINVDYVFVGHLVGPVALGAYVLAFTLASSPGLLLGNVINSIAMPAFSRVKQDPVLLKSAMASALRAVSLIMMPMCSLMIALARPLVFTLYGAKWAASAEVLSILSLYGAISIVCILFANMLTSLGMAKFTLIVQLMWLAALVPAMAYGVHRDGIAGAAIAHIAVIGPLVLPSYLLALKRSTGVRLTMLGKAVLLPLLAASAAGLAARSVASKFASPLAQLVVGLVVGGLIYVIAVAPQAVALLSQKQAAKLRTLRLFRIYDAAARIVRRPVNGEPERRDSEGGYRADSTGDTKRPEPSSTVLTPPSASQDSARHAGQASGLPACCVPRPEWCRSGRGRNWTSCSGGAADQRMSRCGS